MTIDIPFWVQKKGYLQYCGILLQEESGHSTERHGESCERLTLERSTVLHR